MVKCIHYDEVSNNKGATTMTTFEYGFFNDTKKDREYYKKVYTARGFKKVTVKNIKTDTKGLKMYEITLSR